MTGNIALVLGVPLFFKLLSDLRPLLLKAEFPTQVCKHSTCSFLSIENRPRDVVFVEPHEKVRDLCRPTRPNFRAEGTDYLLAGCKDSQAVREGGLKLSDPSSELPFPPSPTLIQHMPYPKASGGLAPRPCTSDSSTGDEQSSFPGSHRSSRDPPAALSLPAGSRPRQARPSTPLAEAGAGRAPPLVAARAATPCAPPGLGRGLCSCALHAAGASKPGGGRRAGPRRDRQCPSP